ncbi:MAG: peroxide stress protein YaaA [Spongiibacteraceae bacterium]|jgi:cytoplasmic iron level regulating protein YaaA (DUF328/UPF0246 family)|nr:peroxide stress protein YaaA [Spongiibacteraceae bacterium]
MLIVISPAKTLDFETPPTIADYSQPAFLKDSKLLIEELRELSPDQISNLMSISPALGELNHQRFMNWKTPFKPGNAKQAVLAFRGDVYSGLDADTFDADDFAWAQQHLRILSGLYGVLRPLDLMQPYRLEMGTRFANQRGANLYEFWGDRLTDHLNDELAAAGGPLVNLASEEYFKAVRPKQLNTGVITPIFRDRKGADYKIISFYAKKARGLMSAFAIKERLDDVQGLKDFTTGGYRYRPEMSDGSRWVFTREEPS